MEYINHFVTGSLIQTVCQINHVDQNQLDMTDFIPDYDEPVLKQFKEILLSLSDKRFFIVGDYDCDGICATSIMKRLFDDLHIQSNYYIPSRSLEGYGLNDKIVDTAIQYGFDVLLCVDNGIIANAQLDKAKNAGLTCLVIDHHEYEEKPHCDAYLHPDLFDEKYEDMCASGICALLSCSIRYDSLSEVYGGLATLADMVKVLGYNRYLLKKAMKILDETTIYPIAYLMKNKQYDYEALSFDVIPKINAVSRMEGAMNVNHLVRYLCDNTPECHRYLSKIEEINKTRKDLSTQMSALALRLAKEDENIITVSSDVFKEGLCGLIANRLMNDLGKPVIVLSETDGLLKGSGRAPKGGDLHAYLMNVSSLFLSYGGHAQAVGLSMDKNNYAQLKQYIQNHPFVCEPLKKDVLCFKREQLDMDLLEEFESLKPFGSGFEEPLFAIEDPIYTKMFMIQGKYPKYTLNNHLEAISFDNKHALKSFHRMIGHLKRDSYHQGSLTFLIEDLF